MEETYDHLLKENNAVASFPCREAAIRFIYYACVRGYQCELNQYADDLIRNYKVTYWKEEKNEPEN